MGIGMGIRIGPRHRAEEMTIGMVHKAGGIGIGQRSWMVALNHTIRKENGKSAVWTSSMFGQTALRYGHFERLDCARHRASQNISPNMCLGTLDAWHRV